jgi:signal transduction histidine kinase
MLGIAQVKESLMRLAFFIRENLEPILQDWESFASTLTPLSEATRTQLRDHAQDMLLVICTDLETYQGAHESIEKSKGNAPEVEEDTAAEIHAIDRLHAGLSLEQLTAEYRAMRASVLRLWQVKVKRADAFGLQDIVRFSEAVDQALTESIARYSKLHRESQNVFLAILGHDVRNPLGAIAMGTQILLHDNQLPDKHSRVARQISRSVERVNEIVSDLLDFSITHLGGGIPVNPASMNFAVECSAIVDELRMFHPASDIQLEIEGDLSVAWDRTRISQALSNLVANALHHGRSDGTVWVSAVGALDHVTWMIQNEGEPIPDDELRFMFDPTKRLGIKSAEQRISDADGHLGLGLYITRAIVEAHKGTISVTSTEVEGTTFTVRLPRRY